MELSQLDILYDFEPKKFDYIDRKVQITQKKIIIQAPPKSGVTYLIFSHLKNYPKEDYLYIDCNDTRIDKNKVVPYLQSYIYNKNIKLFVLDNFDFSFDVPDCDEIVISSSLPHNLKGFSIINFYPLDFEEYIAFEKIHSKIENIFNAYANDGTYPCISLTSEINKVKYLQYLACAITKDKKQFEILKEFSLYQAQSISLFQVFNQIKKKIKISKDSFYELSEDLHKRQIILFLEKYAYPKAQKKLFLMDFALKNALSFEKDFLRRFSNIVFLEIYKREKKVFYIDEADFYIPDEKSAILVIPFHPTALLKNKIKKRKKVFLSHGIENVYIISLGNEDEFIIDGINFEIIPFWNWAGSL